MGIDENSELVLNLTREPREDAYRELLRAALKYADTAQLVLRPTLPAGPSCEAFLVASQLWLSGRREASEWPGTVLLEGTATVLSFRYDEAFAEVLGRAASSLYEWQQPDLPEDLALLRGRQPWLVSVAHERDGYRVVEPGQLTALAREMPLVQSLLRPA
jgi:hypothetical protein